ncbi:19037_t:CDS:2, partial [Racocetra fulgida]
ISHAEAAAGNAAPNSIANYYHVTLLSRLYNISFASPEDSHILSSSIHFAGDFLRHEIPPDEDEELRNSISQSVHGSIVFQQDGNDLGGGLDQSETFGQQTPVQGDTGIEGIQILARLIDKLMSNVKIVFKDTCIRLAPNKNLNNVEGSNEYNLDLEIPIISFRDETPGLEDESTQSNTSGSASVTLPPALSETVKSVTISGLSVWIREALSELDPTNSQPNLEENVFESNRTKDYTNLLNDEQFPQKAYEAMILSCPEEENWIKVTIRPDVLPAIQIDLSNPSSSYHYTQEAIQQANSTQSFIIEGSIKSVISVLTPSHVAWITDLANLLSRSKSVSETSSTESDDDFIPPFNPTISSGASNIKFQHDDFIPQLNPTISSGVSNIKFQLEVSLIELFLLYHDSLPNFDIGRKFFDIRSTEYLNTDHLKINIRGLNCQIERWDPDALSVGKRRNSSTSIGGHSSGFQRSSEVDDISSFVMDIAISQFSISEWLKNPLTSNSKPKLGTLKPESTLPAFDKYTPLLYFDPHLLNSYDTEETDFPSFPVNRNTDKSVLKKANRISSKFSFNGSDTLKEVIKIKFKSGGASTEGLHNAITSSINVEFEPFHVHLDLRIIDRLENYINILTKSANDTGSLSE